MEQSILKSTKKVLHIGDDDESFDLDIMTHINSAFSTLNDLGLGPNGGYFIEDDTAEWEQFIELEENQVQANRIKTFIYLQVRLLFDPPSTVFALNAAEEQLKELIWRINVKREETEWIDPDPPTLPEDIDGILDGGTV